MKIYFDAEVNYEDMSDFLDKYESDNGNVKVYIQTRANAMFCQDSNKEFKKLIIAVLRNNYFSEHITKIEF